MSLSKLSRRLLAILSGWQGLAVGIETVAMESTGVYWIPVFEVLESAGLEVIVANARETRSVPGRKSDINDAQWLQRLHACGLLRASSFALAAI
jgi:transposase